MQRRSVSDRVIERLPDSVIGQIKSSIAITSLNDVVVQLAKNSLDAGASKAEVSVDYQRGSCVVHDDGHGIEPEEFKDKGGLGKLYHTSRYRRDVQAYGRQGTFLASLASLSLLTVISRHHEHRSTNSVVFHRSKCLTRSLPAPPQHETLFQEHGTTVIVSDLFGGMPVRVKQRALSQNAQEIEKLFNALKRDLVGLFVAHGKPVDAKARCPAVGEILHIRDHSLPMHHIQAMTETVSARQVSQTLAVLIDAGYTSRQDRHLWIPLSAILGHIQVKGAISLKPAPSKGCQFISLGRHPLASSSGHNELFDEVNRIFARSSFGTVETEMCLDPQEKDRRKTDKRYKQDGPTIRQLKMAQKGVDRWPRFFFKISIRNEERLDHHDLQRPEDALTQSVMELLSTMVRSWLSSHDFLTKQQSNTTQKRKGIVRAAVTTSPDPVVQANNGVGQEICTNAPDKVSELSTRNRYTGIQSFNDLSRIKSGSKAFYDTAWAAKPIIPIRQGSTPGPGSDRSLREVTTGTSRDQGWSESPSIQVRAENSPESSDASAEADKSVPDTTTTWQDPITRETHLINTRTGMIVLPTGTGSESFRDRAHRRLSRPVSRTDQTLPDLELKQASRAVSEQSSRPTWIQQFLQNWENPIFPSAEQYITQVAPHGVMELSGAACAPGESYCSTGANEHAQFLPLTKNRLSKSGLSHAKVISQVDKKFVLISLPVESEGESASTNEADTSVETLVLVDQHAADERTRVEALLEDLCTPSPLSTAPLRSNLGHMCRFKYTKLSDPISLSIVEDEVSLFRRHASYFARWSILYDVVGTAVEVIALPPTIAERLKNSTPLLSNLLRSRIHDTDDQGTAQSHRTTVEDDGIGGEGPDWLRYITDCPAQILDMINSRACRSACMFNDPLSDQECEDLIQKLAKCTFPFMCAHGRPSMVPLLGLNAPGATLDERSSERHEEEGFVAAFRTWKAVRVGSA